MILKYRSGPQANASKKATRAAFTLLEVLVVVAIIVMLAGAGSYFFFQQYEDAKVSRAKTDVRALSSRVDEYRLKMGDYPPSLETLTQPIGGDGPMCSPEQIRDPWGKVYQIDPAGPRNSNMRADVFTTSPKGVTIGNFAQ